eukprot:286058-Pleurochrysis_carterae.AAC.1
MDILAVRGSVLQVMVSRCPMTIRFYVQDVHDVLGTSKSAETYGQVRQNVKSAEVKVSLTKFGN